MENQIQNKKGIGYYTCCFFVCCIIGWVYEVIWVLAKYQKFHNRGFLFGPYLPIYGFGFLILTFLLQSVIKKKIKIGKVNIMPVIVFLLILIIVSVIEFTASYVLELIFHRTWWDYSEVDRLHIQGRVSLRNSSILAAGGMAFLYILAPIFDRTFGRMNKISLNAHATDIIILMSVDLIWTILGYIG